MTEAVGFPVLDDDDDVAVVVREVLVAMDTGCLLLPSCEVSSDSWS